MPKMWILVADGAKARLFASSKRGTLNEIADFINSEGRAAGRELMRDRPARTYDRFGEGRHAIEPRTSEREKAAEQFARELNSALEQGQREGRYQELMLVAPPRFLGVLNAELSQNIRHCITAQVSKNLTAADTQSIRTHLPL